jgi:hypothetical protein
MKKPDFWAFFDQKFGGSAKISYRTEPVTYNYQSINQSNYHGG